MKNIRRTFLLAAFALLMAETAIAHRVTVFAWVEGDMVFVESKFSGGKKVKDGTIIVTDSNGAELITGKTNDLGEYSFKIPRQTELRITLKAGMGHQAEWTIPIEELEAATPATNIPVRKNTVIKEQSPPEARPQDRPSMEQTRAPVGPSLVEFEEMVEKALDKKLKPVLKMLAESQEKGPTIGDILGGIGYIIGLMGIAAYFRYRKRNL
jgi:nickel transport protein